MAHIFAGSPAEQALRQWISDKLPPETKLIYHGWYGTSRTHEVWLLNCRVGFPLLTQQAPNRAGALVPTVHAFNLAAQLYSMGVTLGGERPAQVWRIDWKTDDKNTDVTGVIYPHADGQVLRIERIMFLNL